MKLTLNVLQLLLHDHDYAHDCTKAGCLEFLYICHIDAFTLQLVNFIVVLGYLPLLNCLFTLLLSFTGSLL